ncbi:downstream of receptor kinase [Carabus blaptoides fortunei]
MKARGALYELTVDIQSLVLYLLEDCGTAVRFSCCAQASLGVKERFKMLQQILRDMWVDPEILAELDEGQKQTLFCKMREEQVRRWMQWDQKVSSTNPVQMENVEAKKSVNFLMGTDGEPWVWVMGEHEDDKSIDKILEEEAREKARKLVEENMVISKDVSHMNEKNIVADIPMPMKETEITIEDCLDIYCSVEELREKVKLKPLKNINNYSLNHYKNEKNYHNDMNREVLHEIPLNTVHKVAQKVALWEKKMMEERIFKNIQKKHLEVAKEAEKDADNQDALWREQERKAKQAEQQIREIARKAREEHRLACTKGQEPTKTEATSTAIRPPSREAVIEWYRNREVTRRAGIDQHNNIEPWFHGLITRLEAEFLLANQENGTFLVRLSERIWGYTITYRAPDKCKHYLIDASNGHYQFLGNNQVNHNTLGDLISYHRMQPLSGGECLVHSCPRQPDSTAFQELLKVLNR